jgi:manganese/zinc/iron transport system substrate-binding protein
VVATTGIVADLARVIVGNAADVTALMGPGVDPHLYKPTRDDLQRLLSADVIVSHGLHLEGRMQDTFEQLKRQGRRWIAVSDGLPRSRLRIPAGATADRPDPHVWMDAGLWSLCAQELADRLSEADPAHADGYRQRCLAYQAELSSLGDYIRSSLAAVPESQRVLVTAHDAFEYFSMAYQIPVHAVLGVSTESEAGLNDVRSLVDILCDRRIPAVFVESSINAKVIQAVAEGAAARGHQVQMAGPLYSDALGPVGTYEGTYLGMIDANVTRIARSLGAEIDASGWRGKLEPGGQGSGTGTAQATPSATPSATVSVMAAGTQYAGSQRTASQFAASPFAASPFAESVLVGRP